MASSKVYQNFDEINKQLEILKIEKDLAYARFIRELDHTTESLSPENIVGKVPMKALRMLGSLSGPLKNAALTWLLKKIF